MQQQQANRSIGRTPCCSKIGLNRGPWTPDEDLLLTKYIQAFGEGRWRTLPKKAGLQRCGKSCRLRWMNYLRPDVKRGYILPEEEDLILRLHRLLGNRWSLIAGRIPGRTDNEIKNYWNTHLSKQLISQGIDPRTHKPLSESRANENPSADGSSEVPQGDHQSSKPQSSTATPSQKRNSDSIDIISVNNTHNSEHQLRSRKKQRVEFNALEFFRNSIVPVPNVVTASTLNYSEPSHHMIEWKSHSKAGFNTDPMFHDRISLPLMDPCESTNTMLVNSTLLNNISTNIPCLEALEPALISHAYSPFLMSTPIDLQSTVSVSNPSSDCNALSHTAPANSSMSKMEFSEYEGTVLSNANNYFDQSAVQGHYRAAKEEVFIVPSDANGMAVNQGMNNNRIHHYGGPIHSDGTQGSYPSYIDSIVHHEEFLHNINAASLSAPSTLQSQNPNSSCDLWSLYQYHSYT